MTSFAENAAQDFGDGEDELAVGNFVADGGGDPVAGGADAALVAGGTEVAGFLSFRSLVRRRMQVKASSRSWPQSEHSRRVNPEARSPQRRKDSTVVMVADLRGPSIGRCFFS